jgi:RNA polymerase sigma-70 factor (ECF subfamily)
MLAMPTPEHPASSAPPAEHVESTAQGATSLTLLARARANEPEAWPAIVQLYTPLLWHWCRRLGVRPDDIEDLTQEVFRAAAQSLASFRRDRPGDTFRGWLRGITRHVACHHFQRLKNQPAAAGGTAAHERLQAVPEELPTDAAEVQTELTSLHRRALELVQSQFEDRTWQAFWRTAIEGIAPAVAAEQLGVSPAAIRKAKSRVLHRLREQFQELLD